MRNGARAPHAERFQMRECGLRRVAPRLAGVIALLVVLVGAWLPGGAAAQSGAPLFTFAQISDSQPTTDAEWARFENVLATLVASGGSGALIPRPVDFVLFAGDLVFHETSQSEWIRWANTMSAYLTANGIPFRAVPGNHDQDEVSVGYYEFYVADSDVWDTDSAVVVGHNGLVANTGWSGLRFIGFNNANGAWNQVSAADLALISSKVSAAAAANENVMLLAHHPHDGQDLMPLASVLPNPAIVGYERGHSGSPGARKGLDGVVNPNVWDLNTNSIVDDGGILYYEVFTNEIRVYTLEMVLNPTSLGTAKVIALPKAMRAATIPAPVANFSGTPTSGAAPLSVAFTDLSTGSPTSWLWTFGDGATSTTRNPTHVYSTPGVYDVSLRATNSSGSNTLARGAYVSALVPPPTQTFLPAADARVHSGNPNSNYGTDSVLRIRLGDPSYRSFLRFSLSGIGSRAVLSAKLRLFSTDSSSSGGSVFAVDSGWTETGITWNNAPPLGTSPLATKGSIGANQWVEYDVTSAVRGDGAVAFGLSTASSNSGYFSSREGSSPPQLVVQTGAPTAPTANFALTPAQGTAPLAVAFTDLSTGGPTSWLWSFGDNTTSTQANPIHVYQSAGTYDVRLTATNAQGSNSLLRSAAVQVAAPVPPTADFSGTPLAGEAPLVVAFTDLSTGNATSWLWSFGDGTTSTARHPSHTYTSAGVYTVQLTASNVAGGTTKVRSGYVSVSPPVPRQTFVPVADARTALGSPTRNYGSSSELRVRAGSSAYRSYLRFDASALGNLAVLRATLRLFVTDEASSGGSVYAIPSTWTETGITWENAPALPPTPLATAGAAALGAWVELDVTPAVRAGNVSFALASASSSSVYYSSREGSNPPQLVVETGAPIAPDADFSAAPTSGPAPLPVAFSDLSVGGPTSWLWSFGDGATSTARNPVHTYAAQGVYNVSLTVGNGVGSDALTRTGYVSVSAPLPINTFTPVADAKVSSASPTKVYGTTSDLRLRDSASGIYRSFVRFDATGISAPVVKATLRLWVDESSNDGGAVYVVPATWTEANLTWATAPLLDGTPVASRGAISAGQWVEFDVTSVVTGNGSWAFGLRNASSDSAYYSSREGAHPPQLVIERAY
jgi:PKD repeat protein